MKNNLNDKNDPIIYGVLKDEYERVGELINFYSKEISKLPAGYLRIKKQGNKEYVYRSIETARMFVRYMSVRRIRRKKVTSEKR
jgi:hypothetical protein